MLPTQIVNFLDPTTPLGLENKRRDVVVEGKASLQMVIEHYVGVESWKSWMSMKVQTESCTLNLSCWNSGRSSTLEKGKYCSKLVTPQLGRTFGFEVEWALLEAS